MTYNDKGEPAYKLTGHPYAKYGVRIWPEILPALGIDLEACKPGPNPLNPPRRVVALLGEHGPKKIIGPAITFTPQPHPSSPEAPNDDEPPF